VKYIVDPGTSQEKVYVIGSNDELGIFDDGDTVVNPVSLGALKPLCVGDHVVDSYLIPRARRGAGTRLDHLGRRALVG
jgi:hypothetical protein